MSPHPGPHAPLLLGWLLLLAGALPASAHQDAPDVLGPASVVENRPGVTGDLHHHAQVRSRNLDHPRDIFVWLPPGYENHDRRYPVLYLQDGNNLFDPSRAFLGREWHLDEILQRMIHTGHLPPLIAVGVGNSPARLEEYTHREGMHRGQKVGGHGHRYARFLVDELKPAIDARYRTLPGREDTAVMGSSLGGLVSLYMAIEEAQIFGAIGAVSPSVWWADRHLLRDAARLARGPRVWIDMGTQEGDEAPPGQPRQTIVDVRDLRHVLVERGFREGEDLGYLEDEGASHDEPSWSRRLPLILRFLYGRD